MLSKRLTYPAIGVGKAIQLDPASCVRAGPRRTRRRTMRRCRSRTRAGRNEGHQARSNPARNGGAAGGAGRGIGGRRVDVVVDVGAAVVVVVVVVVPSGQPFSWPWSTSAAPSARQSTSATRQSVREPVMRWTLSPTSPSSQGRTSRCVETFRGSVRAPTREDLVRAGWGRHIGTGATHLTIIHTMVIPNGSTVSVTTSSLPSS